MPRTVNEQTEDWVESYLFAHAVVHGALCQKIKRQRGWPDRFIVWYGGVLDFIELKRPKGGRFEPLQLRVHAKLRQRGHSVFVLANRLEVDEYIRSRLGYSRSAKSWT